MMKMTKPELTREEVMREIRNIQMFNYTLAPDEVFITILRSVQLAPDDLFKREGE